MNLSAAFCVRGLRPAYCQHSWPIQQAELADDCAPCPVSLAFSVPSSHVQIQGMSLVTPPVRPPHGCCQVGS